MLSKKSLKERNICLTKIDTLTDDDIDKFQKYFENQLDKKVLPISAVSGRNIDEMKRLMWKAWEFNQKEMLS